MMAYNQCFGESFPQFAEQSEQGTSLRQCTCVLGTSGNIQPSFVTNTYRMGVMVTAVCSDLFQRTALANFSIAGDVEMVTNVTEPGVGYDLVGKPPPKGIFLPAWHCNE